LGVISISTPPLATVGKHSEQNERAARAQEKRFRFDGSQDVCG
jgi:hypothetical protein